MRLAAVPLLFGAAIGPFAVQATGPVEVEEKTYLDPADVQITVTVVDASIVEMTEPRPRPDALTPNPAFVVRWGRIALVVVLILITVAILSML